MDLKNKTWKEFFLSDLFTDILRGKRLKKADHKKGTTPYVSSTLFSNGVDGFIGNNEKVRIFNNCLSLANSGSVGSTFFHPYKFVASDHVTKLENEKFNKYIYLFISNIISRLGEKYGFNREINDYRISREKIMLPVTKSCKPDYNFMEQYMKKKEQEKIEAYKKFIAKRVKDLESVKDVESLSEKEWGEFFIEDVAEILSGKDIYEAERFKGNTPYISATAQNNGIGHFVGNKNQTLEQYCLSVNRNGSVGYSFYHTYKALFSNDCRKLRLKNPNKYVGIFISQQITKQRGKYGYGYKMGTARLKRQKIVLPIDKNGNPDYEYMENYMKRIELEKLRKYLEIK